MSKELSENTGINISIKTLIAIAFGLSTIIGMWFMLKADIAEAKTLPKQEVTKVEYELKDELIRKSVLQTEKDIQEIQKTLERIEDKIYDR
jgi:hypothetical protein